MSGRARGRARGRPRDKGNQRLPGEPVGPRQPQPPQLPQPGQQPHPQLGQQPRTVRQPQQVQQPQPVRQPQPGQQSQPVRQPQPGQQPQLGQQPHPQPQPVRQPQQVQQQDEPQGAVGGVEPGLAEPFSGRAAYRGTGRELGPGIQGRGELEPPIEQMRAVAISGGHDQQVARQPRYVETIYRRQDFDKQGNSGEQVQLFTNYFELEQAPGWHVYQYHVDFNPPVESRRQRLALLHVHANLLGPTRAFDGMVLFLRIRLPDETTEVYSQRTTVGENIRIRIKLTAELPPTSPQCLHVYGVILRKILSELNMKQIGRNYYNPSLAVSIPQHKLQVLPGFVESIQQYETAPLLNLDVSNKFIRSETVLDIMREVYDRHETYEEFMVEFTRMMVGQIVLTRYNNKTYRVTDIEYEKNTLSTFTRHDGTEITFKDYYQQQYGATVKEETQYLLVSRSRERGPGNRPRENVLLVPEFCLLTGLGEANNNSRVRTDLADYLRPPPAIRSKTLVDFVRQIRNTPTIQQELAGWDIQFSENLLTVTGRQVPKERVLMANKVETEYEQDSAEWSAGMRDKKMIQSVDLRNWIIIFFRPNGRAAMDFVSHLQRVAPPVGMNIAHPQVVELQDDRNDSYLAAMRRHMTPETQLIMCIVRTDKKDRYDAIKKFTCCDHVVPSQVIVNRTITNHKRLMSVATKVAIQLNCKLGGEVWTVEIPISGLMVIGIDVFHDTVKKGRSVAGFVASMNRNITRHYSRAIFQTTGEELVDKLVVCMRDALANYHQYNNVLPKVIMVYRDGVGDGQLGAVAQLEVPQFQRACTLVGGRDYRPKFGFVVVKKRINTRFFVRARPGMVNPPPGIVVDSTVTKREWYDFFMVSQSVRQGTVTPTHYNVIYDSTGLPPDYMQRLTYKLCHLYYNWPGTIRVPAPCQYAHKLAYLVGQSIHRDPSMDLANRLFYL